MSAAITGTTPPTLATPQTTNNIVTNPAATRIGTYGFNGVVNILSSLNVSNDIRQTVGTAYLDNVFITSSLEVKDGATTTLDKLVVNDTMTLKAGLTVNGALTTLNEGLNVTEDAIFNDNVNIGGILYTQGPQSLQYPIASIGTFYPKTQNLINITSPVAYLSVPSTVDGETIYSFYEYNFINTTFTTTIPILTIPTPGKVWAGFEIRLINAGEYNPITLNTDGVNFVINNNIAESNYTLDGTWNQVSFIYLPNIDQISDPAISPENYSYAWFQTSYQ